MGSNRGNYREPVSDPFELSYGMVDYSNKCWAPVSEGLADKRS
jgi:hypothetical protein